jgi:hypothetical protein
MKFSIGNIVRSTIYGLKNETLIILATKEFPLTTENLKKVSAEVLIKGINRMAKNEIHVRSGFDYEIGKIKSFEGKYCTLDRDFKFRAVFEEDLAHQ